MKQLWERCDIEIKPFEGSFADKSFVNTRNDLNFKVKDYREMLSDLKGFMLRFNKLYQYPNLWQV